MREKREGHRRGNEKMPGGKRSKMGGVAKGQRQIGRIRKQRERQSGGKGWGEQEVRGD